MDNKFKNENKDMRLQHSIAENDANHMTPVDYALVIWKRRYLVIILTVIAAIASLVVSTSSFFLPAEMSLMPNRYKATAMVQINETSSSSFFNEAVPSATLESLADLAGIRTKVKTKGSLLALLAKSGSALDELAEQLILEGKPKAKNISKAALRNDLFKNIEIKQNEATQTITVSYEGIEPEFSRQVANKLVEILDKRFTELDKNESISQMKILENKLNDMKKSTVEYENELKAFSEKYGAVNIEALTTTVSLEYARIQRELLVQTEILKTLAQQYEFAKLNATFQEPTFRVIELAEIPNVKSGPSRIKFIAGAIAATLFVSLFLVFLLEYLERVKADPIEMEKIKKIMSKG